jgi:flavin-dependent dehydrogenase
VRYRLPWSWSSFDYRLLCELLDDQNDARFETAKVEARTERGVLTDRGAISAPLVVDALGWKRVLGDMFQPPEAPLSRGLEVHPPHDASGDELHCWVDRGLVRHGYGWHVPAGDEVRVGVGSYDPRRHVKEPTVALAEREAGSAVRFQGNWFPHRLRPAADGRTFFAGDSAGHCFPLSGEGIRTAFYFGIAAAREIGSVLDGAKSREAALRDYAAFSEGHAPAFRRALRLQRLVPALPPRVLTLGLRAFQPLVDRAFSWYLAQADPGMATAWERTQTDSSRASRPSATVT